MHKKNNVYVFGICVAICILAISFAANCRDTLKIPLQYDIIHLDPARLLDTDSVWIATQLYDGLFELSQNGDIKPRLLASWSASDDNKTYDLLLRENIYFSDGSRLTTKDISYTLERLLKVCQRERPLLALIVGSEDFLSGRKSTVDGIRVIDDRRITLKFRKPVLNLPRILASSAYFVVPLKYSSGISDGSFFLAPIGTGPYTIGSWIRRKELVLKRNSYYWDGIPQLRELHFYFYNVLKPWTDEQLYQFDMLLALPAYCGKEPVGFSSRWYHRPVVEFAGFNMKHPYWSHLRNRQAFSKIFDKKAYYQALFKGRLKSWHATDSVIPLGLPSEGYTCSNAQGATRDALISVENFMKTKLRKIYFASHHQIARSKLRAAVNNSFGKHLRDDVELVLVSPDELLRKIGGNEAGIFFMRLVADLFDPYEILVYFSDDAPYNITGYTDKEYTQKLRDSRILIDERKRARAYTDLAQRLSDNVVVIPIASMFNERLFIKSDCNLKDFGPLGPWYYRMDRIVCR